MKRLCVFCGSSPGNKPAYQDAAREVGIWLARHEITLVYGGGKIGLMGVLADAVLGGGGKVIGVIPKALAKKEVAHDGITELRVVKTMHERKALMAELADGFVAMPGGFGTFDELCEILTWLQLGIHRKPCGLLNLDGFFDPLLGLFERAFADGFLREEHRRAVIVAPDFKSLVEKFRHYHPPEVSKWLNWSET